MKGLLFDKDMKPRITTPDGIQAIKDFAASRRLHAQGHPGLGHAADLSVLGQRARPTRRCPFPPIIGFGESNPNSVVKGKQLACLIPGHMVDGKLVRRSPQAAGTGYMVSAYAKNPELAYHFIQWFTSPSIGDDAVAHPKGFWDPFRLLEPDHKAILDRFGEEMVKTTIENSKYAASLLLIEGNYEYFKILDNNLADVMNKNITAEEAAKRIEAELEQDDQRDRPRAPDPDLAQGRRAAASISTSSEAGCFAGSRGCWILTEREDQTPTCHPGACRGDPRSPDAEQAERWIPGTRPG